MKPAADYTPARRNLQACLEALDAHFTSEELRPDAGVKLLWLIRATHRAWMEASGGTGHVEGLAFAGLSPKLSGAIFLGGMLSLSTTAMAMMQMTVMPAEPQPQEGTGHG